MSLTVTCRCGKSINVPDSYAGKTGSCKACGARLTIPAKTKPAATVDENEVLYSASPAMFRSRPIIFSFCVLVLIAFSASLFDAESPPEARKTATWAILSVLTFLSIWLLRCLNTRLIVTRKAVSLRRGILAKSLNVVRIVDIRNVQIQQSFVHRLFGVGYAAVSTAGQSDLEIEVRGIPNPDQIRTLVDQQRP